MTTVAHAPKKGYRTIRLPLAEPEYDRFLTNRAYAKAQLLKRCTRSLSKPRSYEETTRCRFDPALEPMPAEATHLSPPCGVSTHRSRVVDPDGPTTFLDHREALFGIPQMTSFTQRSGHLERFPVESSPPSLSEDSYRGEAPCSLAPCTRGSHVTLPSVSGLSGSLIGSRALEQLHPGR